jgi:hypothetical protein
MVQGSAGKTENAAWRARENRNQSLEPKTVATGKTRRLQSYFSKILSIFCFSVSAVNGLTM